MARQPKFEIVETPGLAQKWHGRFVWKNGKVRWSTEQYARRQSVIAVIEDTLGRSASVTVAGDLVVFHAGYGADLRLVDVTSETPDGPTR